MNFLRYPVKSGLLLTSRTLSTAMASRKLEGKVAIVTASTDGIGYAIAKGLAENGAKVLISSRKEKNVTEALDLLKGLHVSGQVCHVGKEEDRKKLIDRALTDYGKLDIFVSNAAINPVFGPLLQTDSNAWDKIFDVNVKTGFLFAKEVVPHLSKTQGSMLLVSSIAGYSPMQFLGAYSISKTALIALVKILSTECAPLGVRVNGIAPGVIKTKFSSALTDSPEINEKLLDIIPMRRFGTADECAGSALFLCSDDASYITGEILVISGGAQSRL